MVMFHLKILMWVMLSMSFLIVSSCSSCLWSPQSMIHQLKKPVFKQRTDRFWQFEEQSNSWVEMNLPFDLVSCINDSCTKVGRIEQKTMKTEEFAERQRDVPAQEGKFQSKSESESVLLQKKSSDMVLRVRKRTSITKMSETSIWVTGESGSIYERFWNGVQWVLAPRNLPETAGPAVSVFIVNQTILALSEAGILHQLQLSEDSQPVWTETTPAFEPNGRYKEEDSAVKIKSGVVSHDGQRVYFSTMNGSLLELNELEQHRWINHRRPSGGDVAVIADAATIRPDAVFIVSSAGDLYEFDRTSRPSWKKHIWTEGPTHHEPSLIPSTGCTLHDLAGAHSLSLFLLTKAGNLVERRLHQRKWKWKVHGSPKDHHLTSITPVAQDELNEPFVSLFFTTATGYVFEYRLPKHTGVTQGNQMQEKWLNHIHPMHAKAARGIPGMQLQIGRILFPLDDGRLAELHLSGIGGEGSGPNHQVNGRRKASMKYEWSVLDAPETEGWNMYYCTEERGPRNCIMGVRHEQIEPDNKRATRRKVGKEHQSYQLPGISDSSLDNSLEQTTFLPNGIGTNFRLRLMQAGRSFIFITDGGLTFEYLHAENLWLWLMHEHSASMKGVLGYYNDTIFLVDINGNLLVRNRNVNELAWKNCTAMKKGRQVSSGPPWDGIPGKSQRVPAGDALFFVSKHGRLAQFTVSLQKFKWKDCRNPPDTRIACIVDQEIFRANIVFVIGRNGRLYQYNKLSKLWHEHYQSPHLILSRLPGTAMRSSTSPSSMGSLFMVAEDGGLVEYQWDQLDGWNWIEHGTPAKSVTLAAAPGPCFQNNQLFLIGSDGNVYLRYVDQGTWKWKCYGFPSTQNMSVMDQNRRQASKDQNEICVSGDIKDKLKEKGETSNKLDRNCDAKVASIRPIPFSEDSVIFELRDGRLAELGKVDDTLWMWSRTISTPTSLCPANYWIAPTP